MTTIKITDIRDDDRLRKDYGDIDSMIASIKEFGIIQPLVIARDDMRLVAGGRRLAALRKLGHAELKHGRDFIWREEAEKPGTPELEYRLKAVELEENLRRKDMEWSEIVLAKQTLLEMMKKLHGEATVGGRTTAERRTGESSGFGVRKLASMLGESPATVSRDLQVARAISIVPSLKMESSKDGALKKATAMVVKQLIANGQAKVQTAQPQKQLDYRLLVFCESEKHQVELMEEFLKRGLKCQPVIV